MTTAGTMQNAREQTEHDRLGVAARRDDRALAYGADDLLDRVDGFDRPVAHVRRSPGARSGDRTPRHRLRNWEVSNRQSLVAST